MRRVGLFSLMLLIVIQVLGQTTAWAQDRVDRVMVFAAASLRESLTRIAADFEASDGVQVTVSFAASSALAKQIEAGAPADLFFSADTDWMDYLSEKKLIQTDSRKNLLGNTLVLIAPVSKAKPIAIVAGFPIETYLNGGKLSMAATASVPAGKYGRDALTSLGVWGKVSSQVVEADNVRGALAFVARDEAPLGIVYGTDAIADTKVKVVGTFPANTHDPIVYPVALTAHSKNEAAGRFLTYLSSPQAVAVFEKHGFVILP